MIVRGVNRCMGCMKELKEGEVCSCGFDEGKYESADYWLPLGTVVHDNYIVGRVMGEGGFGITYVGFDIELNVKVAIKEFYLTGSTTRNSTVSHNVSCSMIEGKDLFEKSRDNFLNEARTLAMFNGEAGVVSVFRFFKDNNTAYIIMEFLEGETLKNYVQRREKLSSRETIGILFPVIEALEKIHKHNLIHRDISPDNIMITEDGKVKLIDFGAARENSGGDKSLSIVLKHGYAPIEQYKTHGIQGPWSDIYALCATIYACISGETPASAVDRVTGDELVALNEINPECSKQVNDIVMRGLAILHTQRYQNIGDFKKSLSAINAYEKADVSALRDVNGVAGYQTGKTEIIDKKSEDAINEIVFAKRVDKKRRKKIIISTVGLLFILAMGYGGWNYYKYQREYNKPENKYARAVASAQLFMDNSTWEDALASYNSASIIYAENNDGKEDVESLKGQLKAYTEINDRGRLKEFLDSVRIMISSKDRNWISDNSSFVTDIYNSYSSVEEDDETLIALYKEGYELTDNDEIKTKCVDIIHNKAKEFYFKKEYESALKEYDRLLSFDSQNVSAQVDASACLEEYLNYLYDNHEYLQIKTTSSKYLGNIKLVDFEKILNTVVQDESKEKDLNELLSQFKKKLDTEDYKDAWNMYYTKKTRNIIEAMERDEYVVFLDNKSGKNGQGIGIYRYGESGYYIYYGNYTNGKRNGNALCYGVVINENSGTKEWSYHILNGEWKDDLPQGKFTMTASNLDEYKNDYVFEGNMKDGLWDGIVKATNKIRTGTYKFEFNAKEGHPTANRKSEYPFRTSGFVYGIASIQRGYTTYWMSYELSDANNTLGWLGYADETE